MGNVLAKVTLCHHQEPRLGKTETRVPRKESVHPYAPAFEVGLQEVEAYSRATHLTMKREKGLAGPTARGISIMQLTALIARQRET